MIFVAFSSRCAFLNVGHLVDILNLPLNFLNSLVSLEIKKYSRVSYGVYFVSITNVLFNVVAP